VGATGVLGGAEAEPDGGARLTAAPGSGTNAGGIGGGRSLNSCALAGVTKAESSTSTSAGKSPTPRENPLLPSPPEVMVPAFHRKRGKFKPAGSGQKLLLGTSRLPEDFARGRDHVTNGA
jgi:hypothetical protein